MKYKIIKQDGNTAVFYVLYGDNTYAVIEVTAGRPLDEILKDVYILTVNASRQQQVDSPPEGMEDYLPEKIATTMKVNSFKVMNATVYDQFGLKLEKPISWSVTGTDKARIKDGAIEEDEVEEETHYYIVAVCDELEKKEKHTIYPPAPPEEPVPDPIEEIREELNKQKADSELAIVTLMQMMMSVNVQTPPGGDGESGEETPPIPPMPPMP
ncbi:MAG: hypothetical protein GXZ11_01270 [Tissierellia bacterium]|nr:hypothetical protein [Tissierellia bacterium]